MTTIMREVPGLDSRPGGGFLSGAAESSEFGTGGNDHELARVLPTAPCRAAGKTTAAGASALC